MNIAHGTENSHTFSVISLLHKLNIGGGAVALLNEQGRVVCFSKKGGFGLR